MTVGECSRGTTMGCVDMIIGYVDKDDETNGGGVKRDEVTHVFGGALEDEIVARFSI